MADAMPNQVIADVARDLISQLAPQELPVFRAHSQAYFSDPKKVLKEQAGKDDMLGFGAGEAIALVTPIVLPVVAEVVTFLATEIKKSITAEGSTLISEQVKKMFKKFRPVDKKESDPPPLTSEQLTYVRKLAFEKARQLKLSEARSNLLADSVVGSLTLPKG
jgi:hypothetical protein